MAEINIQHNKDKNDISLNFFFSLMKLLFLHLNSFPLKSIPGGVQTGGHVSKFLRFSMFIYQIKKMQKKIIKK